MRGPSKRSLTVALMLFSGLTLAAGNDSGPVVLSRHLRRMRADSERSSSQPCTSKVDSQEVERFGNRNLEAISLAEMNVEGLGALNFEKLLLTPIRNVTVPLMASSEHFTQQTAALLGKIPSPGEALPQLRKNPRFYLPSDSAVGGRSIHGGITGVCEKDKTYKFTTQDELKAYRAELECIYARGVAPNRPPLGLWYGQIVEIGNTDLFNLMGEELWAGKIAAKSQCKGSKRGNADFYFLHNFAFNGPNFPAFMYTGTLAEPLAPGEYDDGGRHLFVDYVIDFTEICPVAKTQPKNLNIGIMNEPWPLSQLIDLVRKVGEQEDGGSIYLGKTLLRDAYAFPEVGDMTVAFWTVVNYDDDVWSDRADWTLGPLMNDFAWHHAGGTETFFRAVPVGSFIHAPAETALSKWQMMVRNPLGQPPISEEQRLRRKQYPMAGHPDRPEDQIVTHQTIDPPVFPKSGRLPTLSS
eukprot:GHVT01066642.1.p1 GENE.GHVT01066642.1~~GHVT01066642.1.p1  ORF type:complete len:467 (+),score=38.93 GHVT01066642.1:790-2190(+)